MESNSLLGGGKVARADLRRRRMERGLTLQEVSAQTGLPVGVLVQAEADRLGRSQRQRVQAKLAAVLLAGRLRYGPHRKVTTRTTMGSCRQKAQTAPMAGLQPRCYGCGYQADAVQELTAFPQATFQEA